MNLNAHNAHDIAGGNLMSQAEPRHPATEHLMQFFDNAHLPADLQEISGEFYDLACKMVHRLPDGAELTAGLRKLLEAKDCFVRQAVIAAKERADG